MAVAVKKTPQQTSWSALERLGVVSLIGTIYAVGCWGIAFGLIPTAWDWLGWPRTTGPLGFLLAVAALAGLVGLLVLGTRLLGSSAPPGARAGAFVGLLGVLLILLITRWASLWFEHWAYVTHWFGPPTGAILTGVVGGVLLLLLAALLLRKGVERMLVALETQGWFHATRYKPLQGVRVRRGTILGLLLIVAAGIWTLISHGTLKKGAPDWQLNVPFTGRVVIEDPGDVSSALQKGDVVTRSQFDEINEQFNPARMRKITLAGQSNFQVGALVSTSEFEAEVAKLKEAGESGTGLPEAVDPQRASGTVLYSFIPLLVDVPVTVPLLLIMLALWGSWRIVNLPAFADFLIATEAELNKVSWATQRRLVQDTIVVLITVVLLAGYLFVMDQTWRVILSWKPIGVLQFSEEQADTNTDVEKKRW